LDINFMPHNRLHAVIEEVQMTVVGGRLREACPEPDPSGG